MDKHQVCHFLYSSHSYYSWTHVHSYFYIIVQFSGCIIHLHACTQARLMCHMYTPSTSVFLIVLLLEIAQNIGPRGLAEEHQQNGASIELFC